MKKHADPNVSLAPPGAGLPLLELLVAKRIFAAQFRKATFRKVIANLEEEKEEILAIVDSQSAETCSQQVLIKRLRGMEDSSRNWSVFMVLDHLRIVNSSLAAIIATLSAGKEPPGEASTAEVKPSTNVGADVVGAFSESCTALGKALDENKFAHCETPQYRHPWFGPLNAAEWYFMGAFHIELHRKQIERILATGQNGLK